MIIRHIDEARTVDWGNGLSRRLLLEADGMGYTLTDTIVRKGTRSLLEYKRHLEACYCIEGAGEVEDVEGRTFLIRPGVMYALNQHDTHYLIASPDQDVRLVCVFSPALKGDERHNLTDGRSSHY
jgi:L-ectoine synthase